MMNIWCSRVINKKYFSLVYFWNCGKSRSIPSILQGVWAKSGNHLSYFDILASPLTFVEHSVKPLKATSTQLNPKSNFFFFFQRGLNFPWPYQKSKRFHARYAERDVLKTKEKKNWLKSAIIQLWSPSLVYCLGEALNLHRCNKNGRLLSRQRHFSDIVLFSAAFFVLLVFFSLRKSIESINNAAFWAQT